MRDSPGSEPGPGISPWWSPCSTPSSLRRTVSSSLRRAAESAGSRISPRCRDGRSTVRFARVGHRPLAAAAAAGIAGATEWPCCGMAFTCGRATVCKIRLITVSAEISSASAS